MWARLDDAILDNPKIIEAGPLGFALHVAAITWCARNLTDGFIPKRKVASLLDLPSLQVSETTKVRVLHALTADDLATDLVHLNLWHDHGETYELHDYTVYNLTKEEVLARRERERNRLRRKRHRRTQRVASNTAPSCAHPVPVPVPGEEIKNLEEHTGLSPSEWGFPDFWSAYPKKRHKPDALKAWKQVDADRMPCPIRDGLERWKGSDAWRRGFVEDPSTFLRQRQWEDEPAAARDDLETAHNLREIQRGLDLVGRAKGWNP